MARLFGYDGNVISLARMRLAFVLVLSLLLHVALLSYLPHAPALSPAPSRFLDITLDADVPPVRRHRPRARDAPTAGGGESKSDASLRSILDATRDLFRTEMELPRNPRAAPDALPELPALGDRHQLPTGVVRSYRLASGDKRFEYRDGNGKTSVWECPEPDPNDSFAINLCRTNP